MKDSEFIELLNLYVDHEISSEQAARLESEVTASPERRKLYHQYCMMHKACSLLSDQFESEPVVPRVQETRSFWSWSGVFYAGGLAAAACLAAVVVLRNHRSEATAAQAAPALASAPAPRPAVAQQAPDSDLRVVMTLQRPVTFPAALGGGELQTVINTRAWSNPSLASTLPPNAAFDWMNTVQMTPLPAASFAPLAPFNAAAPVMVTDTGLSDPQIDSAAFQFTR